MRLTLAQLRKLLMPYSFSEVMDLSNELDGFEDIISSEPCQVETTLKERGVDTYLAVLKISIKLYMQDAVSLKPIPYQIETTAEELFSTDDSLEDIFLIDGQTLDTKEAILTNILIAKPMSISDEDPIEENEAFEDEPEEKVNPAFAALKDLL